MLIYIEMPVTINGDGPATPEDTHLILYEAWDAVSFETIFSSHDEQETRDFIKQSNLKDTSS